MGTNHPEEKFWPRFCEVMGLPHLENDPKFAEIMDRIKNAPELISILDDKFQQKSRDEWMKIFTEVGLMFAPIQKLTDVIRDPQALANNYIVDFEHPQFGNVLIPGYPASFSASMAGMSRAAPQLGEHTDEVMTQLGFSDSDIAELKDNQVIK